MPEYRRLYQNGGTWFFTVVTFNRVEVFRNDDLVALLNDCFQLVMHSYPFTIEAMAVLPDHLHTIWTLPDGDSDFSIRWNLVKGNFSRQFGKQLEALSPSRLKKRERAIWQRRFWEHLVRDSDDFNRLCDYIHYNPVKHGLVEPGRVG